MSCLVKEKEKKFKNICVRNCFFAQDIIVDFWYPTTQHCELQETTSPWYFLGRLLNLRAPFPKLFIQQKYERPMGLNRRGGLSHLMSLLHSPITHVLCWAVRKEQGPFFPLPPCFWTDSQRSTSYLWLRPESSGRVLSPPQRFPSESLQLFHTNLKPSDYQTSVLKMCPWWYGRFSRSCLVIILCFSLLPRIMLGTIFYWQRWITEGDL